MTTSKTESNQFAKSAHTENPVDFQEIIEQAPESRTQQHIDEADSDATILADSIELRVKQIADSLFIYDERAWFLAAMFNSDFYAANYGLENYPTDMLFQHFLETGMQSNYSPSPAFDPVYAQTELDRLKLAEQSVEDNDEDIDEEAVSVFEQWLKNYFTTVTPHAMFDADFYLALYTDLAESVSNPYAHFATTGLYENRIPCEFLQLHINTVYTKFDKTPANIVSIFNSVPVGCSDRFIKQETQVVLKKIFMPELYKEQLGIETSVSDNELYSHFIVLGADNGLRPTVLFNTSWYLEKLGTYECKNVETDTLREFQALSESRISELKIKGSSSAFFHWYFNGIELGIVPTPLFDTAHYKAAHPDIRNNWKQHPFMHFVETGYKEPFRRHSTMFDANYYKQKVSGLKYNNALLDFTLRGQYEAVAPVAGLQLDYFHSDEPLQSSTLEEAAMYFDKRMQKLRDGNVAKMIAKATELEPQVVRPYGAQLIRMAPIFHPESDLMRDMTDIVPSLPKSQYDIIILMPHCRLAGSANVAGQFTKTVSEQAGGEKVLVITTDLSAFERPDWFPENVDVFDLSAHTTDLRQERKIRILLDLVRGLRPGKLININSNLGWHLTHTFGKQLSAWMEIYFYLFCWDRDFKGNKGGYPIQWFLPTFNFATKVFTDNTVLSAELQNRYCLTDSMKEKIVTLHTPAAQTELNYQKALTERLANTGVRRVFWSGRFDRQKRIDVLFAIANRLPDIEFWVWGKKVLNDSEVGLEAAPENIRFMGTYTSIDDLPIASCDLFLYTSGWDGLPIILIDVASRGIPIVASAVGGVGDLITPQTGWPIDDYANPDAYCKAISTLLSDYPSAIEKGQNAREHALTMCNEQRYRSTLNNAMQLNEMHTSDMPINELHSSHHLLPEAKQA